MSESEPECGGLECLSEWDGAWYDVDIGQSDVDQRSSVLRVRIASVRLPPVARGLWSSPRG
jgi:hypothetical protein